MLVKKIVETIYIYVKHFDYLALIKYFINLNLGTFSSIKPIWNRKFRLQIAYSHQANKEPTKSFCTLEDESAVEKHPDTVAKKQCDTLPKVKDKLSNLEEIKSDMDSKEIAEYLKSLDSTEERIDLLKQLESEMTKKNSEKKQLILHYVGNELVLDQQSRIQEKGSINYQIHRIIYEPLI